MQYRMIAFSFVFLIIVSSSFFFGTGNPTSDSSSVIKYGDYVTKSIYLTSGKIDWSFSDPECVANFTVMGMTSTEFNNFKFGRKYNFVLLSEGNKCTDHGTWKLSATSANNFIIVFWMTNGIQTKLIYDAIIDPSSISVSQPASISQWNRSSTYIIRWTGANSVSLSLYYDGSFVLSIGTGSGLSRFWKIPSNIDLGDLYQIKLNTVYGSSFSDNFEIVDTSAQTSTASSNASATNPSISENSTSSIINENTQKTHSLNQTSMEEVTNQTILSHGGNNFTSSSPSKNTPFGDLFSIMSSFAFISFVTLIFIRKRKK